MSLTLNPAPRLASASSVALSLLLSIACASLPQDFDRAPSFALNNRPGTYLGEVFSDCAATTPGESAIALLDTGRDALMARLALIEAAEHSIDAQYFLWFGDDSGRLLMESLLRAADRGVRVRLLLDDGRANYPDLPMNLIDLHPSVEVRVFNPFGSRRSNLSRTFEMIGNMGRLQHRMHNKLLAIDSLVAVVGGRNIGNKYFGLDPEYNFRDLDVLALGSVVPPHLDSFDDYWNCEWSYPLNVFENRGVDTAAAAELRARLRDEMNSLDDFPYRIDVSSHAITSELHRIRERLVWAPAEVVFDVPSEIMENVSSDFVETVNQLVIEAQHEVLLSAPYLSPPDDSLEAIELAMQRGVTHRVLTNSLASTNLLAAHSVYTKYRKNLLRIGFEIFEMRPDPIFAEDHIAPSIGGSVLGLHAKVAVVDRSQVLVGSYNFNKAGDLMCTENGILISSPALAETVSAMLEQIMRPENSWSVVLEGSQNPENGGSDKLRWIGVEDGHPVRLKSEPEVGFFRRLGVGFYWLFPLKSLI